MEARTLLLAGAGLTLLGAVLLIAGGQEQGVRIAAALLAVLGLLVLALSIWALTAAAQPSALLLGGAALFLAGRVAQIFLRGLDDTLFAALTVANALGTVLLFVGVWQAVETRLRAPPARPTPPPPRAPPARVGSIKPAQPVRAAAPKEPGKPG